MIDNRMISSKAIIAKVIADLELKEPDIRITDIKEYILEAILKIGAIQQYDHKVVILPIINHQAALPCDLYKLGLNARHDLYNKGAEQKLLTQLATYEQAPPAERWQSERPSFQLLS